MNAHIISFSPKFLRKLKSTNMFIFEVTQEQMIRNAMDQITNLMIEGDTNDSELKSYVNDGVAKLRSKIPSSIRNAFRDGMASMCLPDADYSMIKYLKEENMEYKIVVVNIESSVQGAYMDNVEIYKRDIKI